MNFAVARGDFLQKALAEFLRDKGYAVKPLFLQKEKESPAVLRGADCVIFPLPCEKEEGQLNAPFCEAEIRFSELLTHIRPDTVLFGGKPSCSLIVEMRTYSLELRDYAAEERFAVRNAETTAEGALAAIIRNIPCVLEHTEVLLLGFGRSGKMLALKLKALGCLVVVAARKESDFALADALGLRWADIRFPIEDRSRLRAVVNTVPAQIADAQFLQGLRKDAFCLDLSSKPGGIDQKTARKLSLHSQWLLGIPGKISLGSAGEAIGKTVLHCLGEKM